ncbi:MAG TPA: hypothetical protein VN752_10965 [Solirubrobacterales bacterium]|nr:hypothetical protein [Solirubrobacterales bacterium]
MPILDAIHSLLSGGRIARSAAFLAVTSALLFGTPANAASTDGESELPTAATESPAVEHAAEEAARIAASTAPAPVEAEAPEPPETPAVSAPKEIEEDLDAANVPSEASSAAPAAELAVAQAPVERIERSVSSVVHSASTQASEVGEPATGVEAAVAPNLEQTAELTEGIQQASTEPTERIGEIASGIKPAIDRLASAPSPLRRTGLLETVTPAGDPPPPPPLTSSGPQIETPSLSESPRSNGFLHQGAVALDLPLRGQLAGPSGFEIAQIRILNHANDGEKAFRLAAGTPQTSLADSAIDNFGSPAPVDVPPPAPHSPATTASGAGGSSFVPLVALLALLALVPPATLRRPWEAPEFRAPTPFVCALERPG